MAFSSRLSSLLSSSSVVVLPRDYGDLLTRSPKYRNSRTGGARSTRTQIDHDVFEGLPVRHWRKRAINVNTAPEKENTNDMKSRNLAWPELEMPRDAHLLSEMSQNLLRAARMPQAKKTAVAPLTEDDKEPGEEEDADGEIDMGFVAKRWAVIPKDMEVPEPEFLAKRRKGLPSIHGGTMAVVGSVQQMRKTKIRKIGTSGNSSVLEVLVPDGQTVDGEIFEEETSPTQAPAPGTVVEGVGVVNAEGLVIAGDQGLPANNRRRPPPPKRKAKGPKRGRKKRVAFAGADGKPTSIEVNGVPISTTRNKEGYLVDGTRGLLGQDTVMGDHTMLQEVDQEGEEGSEEGSEGEEGEEVDREEGELSPSASPSRSSPKAPSPVQVAPQNGPQTSSPNDPVLLPYAPSPTQTTNFIPEPVTEAVIESVTEPVNELGTEPKVEAMDLAPDEILDEPVEKVLDVPSSTMADEPSGKASPENNNAPAEDVINQLPLAGVTMEPLTDMFTKTLQASVNEVTKESMTELETSAEASFGLAITVAMPLAVEQLPKETATKPQADEVAQPIMKPVADPSAEFTIGAQAEHKPELSTDVSEQPKAESILESSMNAISEPEAVSVSESPVDVTSGPKTSFISESSTDVTSISVSQAESVHEPSTDVSPEPKTDLKSDSPKEVVCQSKTELLTEPIVELAQECPAEVTTETATETATKPVPEVLVRAGVEALVELVREATPPPSMGSSIVTMAQAAEEPAPASVVESKAEPMPEPVVQRAAEHSTEPVAETTERCFSFTRPTASPKAPTPSPPTPIEEKFGLRAPYYSPKAPTMSPPTPIAQTMPSSPEIPLSEQHFQLPPQIDDMPEGNLVPAPDMQDIPNAERLTVESTRQGGPQLNAQIPVDHNPLDGMAAPNVVYGYDTVAREGDNEALAQFSDGEEDLLGSLERSLDRRGNGS